MWYTFGLRYSSCMCFFSIIVIVNLFFYFNSAYFALRVYCYTYKEITKISNNYFYYYSRIYSKVLYFSIIQSQKFLFVQRNWTLTKT